MAYTEFFIPKGYIEARAREMKPLLEQQGDPVRIGAQHLYNNVLKRALNYRSFGPYWWALKEILIKHGLTEGTTVNPDISSVYRGKTDFETLICAEAFYFKVSPQFFKDTNQFWLDPDDPEPWVLFDPDVESDRHGDMQ